MSSVNLKSEAKKGAYWTFLNQASTQLMQFVVGIVMARILSPEDYGITALPAVFMAIAGIFIDGSFTAALVRKKELTEEDLSTSFYYSIGVGVLCYLILFVASPFIADFYNTPILTSIIRVTALGFLWGPLATPQNVILQRKLDFKTPARISIINKIISAIVGISVAYAGYGVWALVVSGLCSSLMGVVQTWFAVKWIPKAKFSKESFSYLWDFGNKMIGASLIDVIYNNITPIFVGKYYSTRDLGIYNRALGYSVLPVQQIQNLIGTVTFPILSKMQDNNQALALNYRRLIRDAAFVSFPVMALLAAISRPLVITMITAKWESSILMLQILCFSKMWWPIMALNKNLLIVKGRTDLFFNLELKKKGILFLLLCASLPFGIIYFCWCQILQTMVAMGMNTYYTGKLIGVGYVRQMLDVFPMFLLAITMMILVMTLNHFIPNMLLQLLLGSISGILFYVGGAYLLKFEEIHDLKYMLSKKK